jgi:hypothetical protein
MVKEHLLLLRIPNHFPHVMTSSCWDRGNMQHDVSKTNIFIESYTFISIIMNITFCSPKRLSVG